MMTADDCTDSMFNSSGGFIVESFWLKINMQIGTCFMPVIAQITSDHFFGFHETRLKMLKASLNALRLQMLWVRVEGICFQVFCPSVHIIIFGMLLRDLLKNVVLDPMMN